MTSISPALARHAPRSEGEFTADLVMELADEEESAKWCAQEAMRIRCQPHVDIDAEQEAMLLGKKGRSHQKRADEIREKLGMIS